MSFQIGLEVLKDIFSSQNIAPNELGLNIDKLDESIDSILVKQLKKKDILDENVKGDRGTRDTDIRFSKSEGKLFSSLLFDPYIDSDDKTGKYKKWFILQLPIELSAKNMNYLSKNSNIKHPSKVFDYTKNIEVVSHITREKRDTGRFMMGYKSLDSKDFMKLRQLLFEDDFLVILKKFSTYEYIFLGIKKEDGKTLGLDKLTGNGFLHEQARKVCTPISTKRFKEVSEEDIIANMTRIEPTSSKVIGNEVQRNLIVAGAPGTGKSNYLDIQAAEYFSNSKNITRLMFHSQFNYSHFMGTYKPTSVYRQTDNQIFAADRVTQIDKKEPLIDYTFVAGPFIKMLCNAYNNPEDNYLMIIEEINRANVSNVFGEVFQLLDRKADGEGKYGVEFNPDVMNYLRGHIDNFPEDSLIKLPKNFFIWATMNNADQGVLPLDSAFKRRWSYQYFDLDTYGKDVEHIEIHLKFLDKPIKWNTFRKVVNEELKKLPNLNEDKLIGPFFLTEQEIQLGGHEVLKNKLFAYLRNDVLKNNVSFLFKKNMLSDIFREYEKGNNIFNISEESFLLSED